MLFSPLFGHAIGERIAVTLLPLLTLAGIMAGIALATLRIASRRAALIAALIAGTTPLILFYTLPLRIDHHGWQVMMAALTLAACFDPRARRGGLIAGFCAATWLAISMEGLPLVTAITLMLGLRFAIEGRGFESDRRCRSFLIGLSLSALCWLVTLRGPHAWSASYGDMLSPAWLGPLSLGPIVAVLAMPIVAGRGMAARFALLIAAAFIGVGALFIIDPNVLAGPFKALDPLVLSYWYDNVSEGLPIWKQSTDTMMMIAAFPVVGLAARCWHGARRPTRSVVATGWRCCSSQQPRSACRCSYSARPPSHRPICCPAPLSCSERYSRKSEHGARRLRASSVRSVRFCYARR